MKKLFLLFALLGFFTFTTACGGGGETEATTEDSTTTEPAADEPAEPSEPEVETVEPDTTVADTTAATPVEKVEE